MRAVVLKKGKEVIFDQRHHWIFSGAIAAYPSDYIEGELIAIKSHEGVCLGFGYFNKGQSLAGRIVSFGQEDVYAVLHRELRRAVERRLSFFERKETTAFRLVNGEGDGIPGLIIDWYAPYAVIQTGSLGMQKLLPFLVETLVTLLPSLKGIYDKSSPSSLKAEGLISQEKILWGELPEAIEIQENGIFYRVNIQQGQKTGFFLDQREMRKWVTELSYGKTVLNGFCYTGGFSCAALKGGALRVDSVEISSSALQLCQENVGLNGYDVNHHRFFKEDVFTFLEEHPCHYDLMILDPPAFAKKRKDIPAALKGYKRIFKSALSKLPAGSFLLLSSCSHYITEEMFESTLREAGIEVQRAVRIIGKHRLAYDHPINLFHPESAYLKSLLIEV